MQEEIADASSRTRRGAVPCTLARAAALALGWLAAGDALAQSSLQAPPVRLPDVEVIGTTPLPGLEVERDTLPYATQLIRRERIDDLQPLTQLDALGRSAAGVQLSDVQGSPYQTDLLYRGYRASSLLGAGQGLSVYLDGVRINEPFGDVVNFDLVPEYAVRSIALVPGANPAFGLNSLGGALVYTTYDGRSAPGLHADASLASFGRRRVEGSLGGHGEDGWHGYMAATFFQDGGWRDFSDGHLARWFGKWGRDEGDVAWDLSVLAARSVLTGNGLVPALGAVGPDDDSLVPDLYAQRREAVYTYPDRTENRAAQAALNLRARLCGDLLATSLLYVRSSLRDTLNGDVADDAAMGADANGAMNTTHTRQTGYGAAAGLSRRQGDHQWQIGASVDASRVDYEQATQSGMLTADRGVLPLAGTAPLVTARLSGRSTAFGVYATDTWKIARATHLTGTARFNHSSVSNDLASRGDDDDALAAQPGERFTYRSFNPALGMARKLGEESDPGAATVFANLARNTRAPTAIELGCADPTQPCRLPAGLQSDPYLSQVRAITGEIGLRVGARDGLRFEIEAWRSDNRDDILFHSLSTTGQLGYFANFPKTRNQGVEVQASASTGPWDWSLGYSLLDATYQASGVLREGPRNVPVVPGTPIAGLARHNFKVALDWRAGGGLSLGADAQAFSRRTVAGNEDGRVSDDDVNGAVQTLHLPGYAVLNLRATWQPDKAWSFFAGVSNVFDRRYESFGAIGLTRFDAQGAFTGEDRSALFVGPGAPRSVAVGLRWRM